MWTSSTRPVSDSWVVGLAGRGRVARVSERLRADGHEQGDDGEHGDGVAGVDHLGDRAGQERAEPLAGGSGGGLGAEHLAGQVRRGELDEQLLLGERRGVPQAGAAREERGQRRARVQGEEEERHRQPPAQPPRRRPALRSVQDPPHHHVTDEHPDSAGDEERRGRVAGVRHEQRLAPCDQPVGDGQREQERPRGRERHQDAVASPGLAESGPPGAAWTPVADARPRDRDCQCGQCRGDPEHLLHGEQVQQRSSDREAQHLHHADRDVHRRTCQRVLAPRQDLREQTPPHAAADGQHEGPRERDEQPGPGSERQCRLQHEPDRGGGARRAEGVPRADGVGRGHQRARAGQLHEGGPEHRGRGQQG